MRLALTGPDVNGYVDGTTLVDQQISPAGGWLMLAQMDVSNVGGADDSFNCALAIGGQQMGGGGLFVGAGTTAALAAVGFGPADAGDDVAVVCDSNGVTTFDVANVRVSLTKLM